MSATVITTPAHLSIVSKINSLNIAHCILGVLFVGAVLIMGGIFVECNYEIELLQQSGNAFLTYQSQLNATAIDSMHEYVLRGISGRLISAGGVWQAYGIAFCYVLAPLVGVAMYAMRMIVKPAVKDPWNFALA